MAGASSKRGLLMCTLPRLVGLRLQTLAVNAGKACSGSPKASSESGWTWNSRFACGCSGELRVKAPSYDGDMLIGPLRRAVMREGAAGCAADPSAGEAAGALAGLWAGDAGGVCASANEAQPASIKAPSARW